MLTSPSRTRPVGGSLRECVLNFQNMFLLIFWLICFKDKPVMTKGFNDEG